MLPSNQPANYPTSFRIGPRRQGFASPLRALDGSGPIRGTTLFTRGKGGFGARGRVASPLAHDKGYYHAYCGAKPKASFRPYQLSEPQPRGAVTRRAVIFFISRRMRRRKF